MWALIRNAWIKFPSWGAELNLTFYGVRGSTPCASESNRAYGGNTACVVIESPGRDPMILDLGTGLRFFGLTQPKETPFTGTALVSHLHWDHIQGIPFFTPLLREGGHLDLYGPVQDGKSLEDTIRFFMQPPYFPIGVDDLPGKIVFHELLEDEIEIQGAHVRSVAVPHCGLSLGFRIECDGASVAYVSDHQQPSLESTFVDPGVVELCRGVDVLIHDAQFNREEFIRKSDWGHCTYEYAVEVAAQAEVGTLVLFHHDPSRSDTALEAVRDHAGELAAKRGVAEVIAASEGLRLQY